MADDAQALLLQVSADIRGLEKAFDRAVAKVRGSSKQMESAGTSLEKFFGKPSLSKALDKVFDSTRFKILDSGVARVGVFGGALEALGPAGLAAAAGVGAVAAAFAGAREAAKFADDIHDTAERLHVTTDALQEYRYAIRAAGGEEKGADEALAGFSETLGKAEANLPKALRVFKELFGNSFTAADVAKLGGTEEALVKVTKAMEGLSNEQRDAVISQAGLTGLKDLIDKGADAMVRLRAEAHKVGIVMDGDLVKRGGDLNDQFETVAKVIDVQLKSALVDLGPVLVGILQQMADLAKAAADVADAFRSIEDKRTDHLKALRQQFVDRAASPVGLVTGAHDRARVAEIDAELAKRAAADAVKPPKPTKTLTNTTPGATNDTVQRTEGVNAAVAQSARELLQAQGKLTEDITARAAIERDVAAEELKAELAKLEKQRAEVEADKGISAATKATLGAKLDEAETNAKLAAAAKVSLINRDAAFAIEDRQIEVYKDIVGAQVAQLEAEAATATTAAQRTAIEKRILDLRQQLERDLTGTSLDRQLALGAITPQQHAQQVAALGQAQGAAQVQFATDHAGPLQQYLRSIQDLNTEFQTAGVQAIQSLSDSLADALINAKNLGDVARNVFNQLLQQILSATIQKNIVGPLLALAHIPGFAGGTSFAPGGMALVGEHGPEFVNLPRGAQVIPNNMLSSVSGGRGVQQTVIFDNRGAVLWDQKVAELMSYADQQALSAGAGAVQLSRGMVAGDFQRRAKRTI